MHDLHCKNADEMHSPVLAKRVHELKDTQKGVELMCHEMEKIYSEGMENGEKRGIEKIAAFWLKLPVVWVFFIVNLDELLKVPAVYVPFATAS